jgi:hypothetical protein
MMSIFLIITKKIILTDDDYIKYTSEHNFQ